MSLEIEQIKSAASKFAGQFGPSAIRTATVLSVGDHTVSVQFVEGAQVDDCRLKAVVKDGSEIVLVPAVGSVVLVGMIENSYECVILSVSEITEVRAAAGDARYSFTQDGFLIKKGEDSLLEVFELVIQAVQQIVVIQGNNPNYEKLTQALQKVENILRNEQ